MAMSVNTNLGSLSAQRNLGASQSSLSTSMSRLSSGLRINNAKDDAAGLAIADRMNAQVKGMNVAIRNANDGISMVQTADSALSKITESLQRMRELAVQSANGTNTAADRANLTKEFNALGDEIGRVIDGTSFNGKNLFKLSGVDSSGTAIAAGNNTTDLSIQVGANTGSTDQISITMTDLSLSSNDDVASPPDVTGKLATNTPAGTAGTLGISMVYKNSASNTDTTNKVYNWDGGGGVNAAGNLLSLDPVAVTYTDGGGVTHNGTVSSTGYYGGGSVYGGVAATTTDGTSVSTDMASGGDVMATIATLDLAIDDVSTLRANFGAAQNRLEAAISNLQSSAENTSTARSRIMDADFATESSNMARAQILQQASMAMLAQANQNPQQVMKLLQ